MRPLCSVNPLEILSLTSAWWKVLGQEITEEHLGGAVGHRMNDSAGSTFLCVSLLILYLGEKTNILELPSFENIAKSKEF